MNSLNVSELRDIIDLSVYEILKSGSVSSVLDWFSVGIPSSLTQSFFELSNFLDNLDVSYDLKLRFFNDCKLYYKCLLDSFNFDALASKSH